MNARERLLVALDGGEPDRVPRALGFSRVDVQSVVPQGWRWAGDERLDPVVDVRFVRFPPSPEDEALRRLARPFAPDTRLGTPVQVANYASLAVPSSGARSAQSPGSRAVAGRAARFSLSRRQHALPRRGLANQVQDLHERGLAVGGSLPHLGGELFETAWRLRGLENLLLDLVERPDWARLLLDRLTDMARRNARDAGPGRDRRVGPGR